MEKSIGLFSACLDKKENQIPDLEDQIQDLIKNNRKTYGDMLISLALVDCAVYLAKNYGCGEQAFLGAVQERWRSKK